MDRAAGNADVIVVEYDPPTPLTTANIDSHLLFGACGRSVTTTIIGGRVVMQDRVLTGIDESEILAKARAAASKLWQRF
jgi:cytosine/adenosine deaminase-related metal-dependent hydrolase